MRRLTAAELRQVQERGIRSFDTLAVGEQIIEGLAIEVSERRLEEADVLAALHRLAMLALQSDRYHLDAEFHHAVEAALALHKHVTDRAVEAGIAEG